jgi:quercetin dioxygenase-like cupin family protein
MRADARRTAAHHPHPALSRFAGEGSSVRLLAANTSLRTVTCLSAHHLTCPGSGAGETGRAARALMARMEMYPSPQWERLSLDRPGCRGVSGRVLFLGANLGLVELSFEPHATIDAHALPYMVEVVCMEGSGFVRVGEEASSFEAGFSVRWPMGVVHSLWTADAPMTVITIEHVGRGGGLT